MHHPLAGDKLGALVKTLGLIIVLCVSAIANPAKGMAASLLSNRPDDLALLQQMLKQQTPVDGYVALGDILFRARDIEIRATLVPNRWTNGRFVFAFESNVSAARRAAFAQACNAWTTNTPIVCVERTNEKNYAIVKTHVGGVQCGGFNTGCSALGMLGGEQPIWMKVNGMISVP
jgi:Astacin (Peptidase family M12A)